MIHPGLEPSPLTVSTRTQHVTSSFAENDEKIRLHVIRKKGTPRYHLEKQQKLEKKMETRKVI